MSLSLLPGLLLLLASCAIAQPGQGGGQRGDRQAAREQLRGELRGAAQARPLQTPADPARQTSTSVEKDKPGAAGRQLTQRERAEMRQQLRQQQFESRKPRP